MGKTNNLIEFFGGLNFDDALTKVAQGDYRNAINIRNGITENGNKGSAENAKGNLLVTFNLPTGTNKTIGTYNDEEGVSIIYFVHNSNGDHGIYQYLRSENKIVTLIQDSILNFNEEPITGIGLIDDLLFWTDDDNRPRKINIEKAREDNKFCKNNLYFGKNNEDTLFALNSNYFIRVEDILLRTIASFAYTFNTDEFKGDLSGGIKVLVNEMNNNSTFGSQVEAKECGQFIELTNKFQGYGLAIIVSSEFDAIAAPQNFYARPYAEEVINQNKASIICEPKVSIEVDSTRNTNYLVGKIFQFRTRLYFDDSERSALSPISKIVTPTELKGEATVESDQNLIIVDFTDDRLNDQATLSSITKVEILMKEHNDTVWKSIDTLDQWQLGVNSNTYKFYNDGVYSAISDKEAQTYFWSIPIKSKDLEISKNYLFHANILEGYDQTCIDCEVNIGYEEVVKVDTFSISGSAFIRNFLAPQSSYPLHQPIWDNSTSDIQGTPVWGGFGNLNVVDSTGTSFNQIIPLKGFVVYLAGTDYYGVSVQRQGNGGGQSDGVYTSNSNNDIRGAITGGSGGSAAFWGETVDTRVWSDWTINNVPSGRYILRVASHLTTETQLASRDYQRTSTNLFKINNESATEIEINIDDSGNITLLDGGTDSGESYYQNGNVKLEIEDLTNPRISQIGFGLSGYLMDHDNTITESYSDFLTDTRIELADIEFDDSALFSKGITDHNGFFFARGSRSATVPIGSIQIDKVNVGSVDLSFDALNQDDSNFDKSVNNGTSEIAVRASTAGQTSNVRTSVSGAVTKDSGTGIKGASIIISKGETVITDVNGNYETIVYVDTDRGNADRSTDDGVILSSNGFGNIISTTTPKINFDNPPLKISSSQFNEDNPYPGILNPGVLDFIAKASFSSGESSVKRGGDYRYGKLYLDFYNQQNTVNTNESLNKHVLFYTEEDSETGTIPNEGKPVVSWKINGIAPEFATHYQWVRTKNLAISNYIQLFIHSVKYLNESGGESTFEEGEKIELSLESLAKYQEKFPNSVIGMNVEVGDRVRFIRNSSGNLYSEYIDKEVISVTDTTIQIYQDFDLGELKEGLQIEIYKVKATDQDDSFFEIGECFEVKNRFHQGPKVNQFNWRFDDNFFSSNKVGFVSTEPHEYQVGDVINIIQDAGAKNQSYNGETTIVSIPNQFQIVIDKTFASNTPVNPGGAFRQAEGDFNDGDAYYRVRTMPTENGSFTNNIDSNKLSDFFDSEAQSIGRIQRENKNNKQLRREDLVRHGAKIFEDTEINGLIEFEGLNSEKIPKEHGSIQKLKRVENVLLCINEFRTNALYIEEALLTTRTGTDSVTVSDKVIGAVRAFRGNLGTINPESVHEYEGNALWWDANKGSMVKYSANGIFQLEAKKAVTHFSQLSKNQLILSNPKSQKAYIVYDSKFEEWIISFEGIETIAYSEENERWESFWSYLPENSERIGKDIVTFKDGQLWLHNSNDTHNSFYGTVTNPNITFVMNQEPRFRKTAEAIRVEGNSVWYVTSAKTIKNGTYKEGMETRILKTSFNDDEGDWYASFARDKNDPRYTDEAQALVNGRKLRAHSFLITLENDETEAATIHSTSLKTTISERNF